MSTISLICDELIDPLKLCAGSPIIPEHNFLPLSEEISNLDEIKSAAPDILVALHILSLKFL